MPKKARIRRKEQTVITTIPSADNAKWLGIGFIASVVLVTLTCILIFQLRGH